MKMGMTAYATSTMTKLKIKITLVRSDQNMSLVLSHLSAMTPPMNNKKIWGKVDPIITNHAITADNVTFSPRSTRIDLSVDYPAELDENDRWPWFEYTVVDDQGRVYNGMKLQTGMADGTNGHHMVLTLPPMDEVPGSLTLMPSEQNRDVSTCMPNSKREILFVK